MEPKFLEYHVLEEITDGFSEERTLGEGGFGKVYKGIYNGEEVAVKKLHSHLVCNSEDSFQQEVDNIWRLRHENIVRLIGYCSQVKQQFVKHDKTGRHVFADVIERALCFEYMQNGSLENYLSDECDKLDWHTTYKIIKGTCEGLKYIHEECNMLHLDLKPDNILLDKNMVAKIADFGLSKIVEDKRTMTIESISGTPGYMPPETFNNKISIKCDIFSLGVVIIKTVTGPANSSQIDVSPEEFIERAEEKWKSKLQATCSDSLLLEEYCKQVKMCTEIALECANPDRKKRPSILDIISKLNGTEVVINKLRPAVVHKEALLCFNPTEIRFPLLNNCSIQARMRPLQLINLTETYVASKIIPPQNASVTQAVVVVPPKSRFTVFLTPDESRTTTEVMDNDNFYVHSTKITKGTNVADELFSSVAANSVEQVVIKSVYLYEEKPAFPLVQPGVNIKFPVSFSANNSLITLELHSAETWFLCLCSLDGERTLSVWNYKTQECLFKNVVSFDTAKFWGSSIVASHGFGIVEIYNISLTQSTPLTRLVHGPGTPLTLEQIYYFQAHSHAIRSLAIPPNGQYILTSDVRGDIRLWNRNCNPVQQFEGHSAAVTEVKFNLEQYNIFASASRDCKVKIWNLSSTKPDAVLVHSSEVTCVDFVTAKSLLISGSDDNTLMVWDYQAKICLRKLEDTSNVRAICSHPKIPIIFSGLDNGTIRLWNSNTNSIENSIAGFVRGVRSIDRKDTRVAIGCEDLVMILESEL